MRKYSLFRSFVSTVTKQIWYYETETQNMIKKYVIGKKVNVSALFVTTVFTVGYKNLDTLESISNITKKMKDKLQKHFHVKFYINWI